jgi:hypothetical protein
MSPVERGCLVIADIGGYTKYLTGVELEHSTDILADLLNVVVDEMTGLLHLAKLEGDAVFAHGEASAAGLVPMLDACYFGFRTKLRTIENRTSCRCDACRRIPDLDLKFVAHHGKYAVHSVAGREELVGPEVITVHRLLKNTVQETFGLRGYALLTQACADAAGIACEAAGMSRHTESYDDVGEIGAWVLDLDLRWRREQERATDRVATSDADVEWVGELEAPPPLAWTWMTDPQKRLLWQSDTLAMDQANPDGLVGVGTTNHCVHGAYAVDEEILDWKPFAYFTDRTVSEKMRLVITTEFEPVKEGRHTRVTWRARPVNPDEREGLLAMAPMFTAILADGFERLNRLLAD